MTTISTAKTAAIAAKGMSGFLAIVSPSPAIASAVFGWANVGLIASLVVGVISTFLIVWMGNVKEDDLRGRIANAVSNAASANAGLAAANAEIETQKRMTAEAQLETQRLKDKLAPRQLSDQQVSLMADELRPFASQKFGMFWYWDSVEPSSFAGRLRSILDTAGWKYVKPESQSWLVSGVVGVLVYVDPKASAATRRAADTLVKTLRDQGMEAKTKAIEDAPDRPPTNTLAVNIGSKS